MVGSTPERAAGQVEPAPAAAAAIARRVARRPGSTRCTSPAPTTSTPSRPGAAIDAGVAVVCEKPLGVTAAETAELVAAADAAGVVNAVCFNLRFYPQNQNAAAMVAAGAIGAPRFCRATTCRTGCCSTPTGTGASTPAGRASCGPSPTSGRTGSTSPASSPGSGSPRCAPTSTRSSPSATARPARWRRSPRPRWTTSPGARAMASDDAAGLLLRYDGGARGPCAPCRRCRRAARTRCTGRSTARRRRWRGRPPTRSGCGSATAGGPTSSSRRIRRS